MFLLLYGVIFLQQLRAQCLLKGHCLNDPCNTNKKCSGMLSCNSANICVLKNNAQANPGAKCIARYDCGGGLKCQNGVCTKASASSQTPNASSNQKIEKFIPPGSLLKPSAIIASVKATPSKVALSKATPSKATPSKATSSKATPSKATSSKATSSKATSSKATPLTAPSKPEPPAVPVANTSSSTGMLTSDQNQKPFDVAEVQNSVADPTKPLTDTPLTAPSESESPAVPVVNTSSSTNNANPIEDQKQPPFHVAIKSSVQDSTSSNQSESLFNAMAIKSSVADPTNSTPSLTSPSSPNPATDMNSPVSDTKVHNSEPQQNRASDNTVLKDPKVLVLIVLACCSVMALAFFAIYKHQTKKRSESGQRKDLENYTWDSLSKVDKKAVEPVHISSYHTMNSLPKKAVEPVPNHTMNSLSKKAAKPMFFSLNRVLNSLSKTDEETIAPSLCTSRSSNREWFPISYISRSGIISDRYTYSPFDFAFSEADGVSDVQTNSYPSWLPPTENGEILEEDSSDDIPSYHAARTSTFSDDTTRDSILATAKAKILLPSTNNLDKNDGDKNDHDQISCASNYEFSTLSKFKSFDFVNPDQYVYPSEET